MLKQWRSGQFVLMVCVAAVFCGCATFEGEPLPGGPPRDSDVIESITNDPGYSLALLCDHEMEMTARNGSVLGRGWEKRLLRLGLPCHKDLMGTTLESATPEGIPFTINVDTHVTHPGNPDIQFQVEMIWTKTADIEPGKRSLLALESKKPVKG